MLDSYHIKVREAGAVDSARFFRAFLMRKIVQTRQCHSTYSQKANIRVNIHKKANIQANIHKGESLPGGEDDGKKE